MLNCDVKFRPDRHTKNASNLKLTSKLNIAHFDIHLSYVTKIEIF